jgi:hypothetical protein
MKLTLILSAIAVTSLAGNAYLLNGVYERYQQKSHCSYINDRHACELVAQPVKRDDVAYAPGAVLPPPVL